MDPFKKPASATTLHHSKNLFKGRIFSFVEDDITLPNGVRTHHAVVRHPGSAAVVPLLEDQRVAMTSQYRHAVDRYLLEIPGGTMEPGESPEACAKRELEEETGLVADTLEKLGEIDILPGYSDEIIHLYLARNFVLKKQRLDADEIIQVEYVPLKDLIHMCVQGQITEALTILALQRTWMNLNPSTHF